MSDSIEPVTMIRVGTILGREWTHRWLTKDARSEQYGRHMHAVLLVGPTSPEGVMTLELLRRRGIDPKQEAAKLVRQIDELARAQQ